MAETEGSGSAQDAAMDRLAEMERAKKEEAAKAEAIKQAASADEALRVDSPAQATTEEHSAAPAEAPADALPPAPQIYVVQAGDSLSSISEQLYGDAKYWDTILFHNKDKISDPNLIYPGQELVIPWRCPCRHN